MLEWKVVIYIEYIKIVINDFKTPIPYLIQAMFISATGHKTISVDMHFSERSLMVKSMARSLMSMKK